MVFDFGSLLVHDNGVLLLLYQDNLRLMVNIKGYCKAYHFSIFKGINQLPITNTKDASKTVSDSYLVMYFILLNTLIFDFYLADYISCFIHV